MGGSQALLAEAEVRAALSNARGSCTEADVINALRALEKCVGFRWKRGTFVDGHASIPGNTAAPAFFEEATG